MVEKTRVLLVEVFPRVAQRLNDLLERVDFIETIPNNISNSEMALATIRQTKPDIVLLELDLPGLNGIQCTEIIRRDFPMMQVVILSELSSAETVRLAMRAGAVDYLNYNNLTFEELFSVLERTNNIVQQEKMRASLRSAPSEPSADQRKTTQRNGKVISVFSPKGGSGVSTVVANLGYLLNESSKSSKVVLVDLDLQFGDIALLFNQMANRSIIDLAIRVQNLDEELVESVIFTDDNTNTDILASPQRLELSLDIESTTLSQIISQLRLMYDYILINTNSYLTEGVLSCFALSDLILLLSIQQVTAIRSIRSMLNFLRENGIGKDKIMLVLNRYDETNTITPKKIGEMLSLNVAHTIPNEQNIAEKAANLGIPFTLDNPKHPISKSYQKLLETVKTRLLEREGVSA